MPTVRPPARPDPAISRIWHVPLSATRLGSFTGKVTATVNGVPWTTDVRQIPLEEHTQIVLNLGGPLISPPPISWSGTGL